jgi:hypothetical protein
MFAAHMTPAHGAIAGKPRPQERRAETVLTPRGEIP